MQAAPRSHRAMIFFSLGALMVACAGCGGSPVTNLATPTPTLPRLTPIPTDPASAGVRPPPFSGSLADPPTDCPTAPAFQTMSQDNFGGGFSGTVIALGVSPVWGWPGAAGTTIHFEQFGYNPWPNMKNLWLLGPNYNKPITLTRHDVRTGTPLWFQLFPGIDKPIDPGDEGTYTSSAVLDPATPNRGSTDNNTGHWNIWGTGIIVLQAGCYELDATWAEGSWHTIYAIGR